MTYDDLAAHAYHGVTIEKLHENVVVMYCNTCRTTLVDRIKPGMGDAENKSPNREHRRPTRP